MGAVVRAQGLRGEFAVHPFNPSSGLWAAGERFWAARLGQQGHWLQLEAIRLQGRGLVASLAGIRTREAAEELVGCELSVDRSRLPSAGEHEVYLADLMGWTVVERSGRTIGRVVDLVEAGKRDFLVVEQGARREFIPVEAGLFGSVDAGHRLLTLDVDIEAEAEGSPE